MIFRIYCSQLFEKFLGRDGVISEIWKTLAEFDHISKTNSEFFVGILQNWNSKTFRNDLECLIVINIAVLISSEIVTYFFPFSQSRSKKCMQSNMSPGNLENFWNLDLSSRFIFLAFSRFSRFHYFFTLFL